MKILPLLLLALVIHTGCASRPVDTYRVEVRSLKGGMQFEFVNASGRELHNAKIKGYLRAEIDGSVGEITILRVTGGWPSAVAYTTGEIMTPMQMIQASGKCTEGKIECVWAEPSNAAPVQKPKRFWSDGSEAID